MYFHSLTPIIPLLATLAPTISAHGSHAPPVLNAEGIDDRNYMQKHVSTLPRLHTLPAACLRYYGKGIGKW